MAYDIDPTKTRQPNSDRLKVLYDALKEDGADVGDSWQFRDWMMADENNRKTVWQAFKDDGADVGEYDEFDTWLFDLGQQPTAATQPTAQQPTQRKTRYDVAQEQYQQGVQQTNATPISQTAMGSVGGYGISPTGMPVRNTQGYPQANPQPKAPAKPMAPAPRAGQWSGAPMQQTPYAATEEEGNKSFMPIEQGEDTKQRYNAKKQAVGKSGGQVETMLADVDARMNEAYKRDLKAYGRPQVDEGDFWTRMGRSLSAAEGNNPMQTVVPEQLSEDTRDYQAAHRALVNAQQMIDAANNNSGILQGMKDKAFDITTWDFGITDMADAAALNAALKAYDEGKELTESQKALLDAKALEMATNLYYAKDLGRGYTTGEGIIQTIPMMYTFIQNPISGASKSAATTMGKYMMNRFGKQLVSQGKKKAAKWAVGGAKFGTRVALDPLAAAGITATSRAMRVTGGAIDRMNGIIKSDTDGQGNVVFGGHTDMEDADMAGINSFLEHWIDTYSEFALDALPLGSVFKGASKTKAGKFVGFDKIYGFFNGTPANKFGRAVSGLEKRAAWHGMFGEFFEEIYGGILNALLVGDQTLDTNEDTGVFNRENLINTAIQTGIVSGVFCAAKTGGYMAQRRRARIAGYLAADTFGNNEVWQPIKEGLDADDKTTIKTLQDVFASKEFTEEQKRAALRYAFEARGAEGAARYYEKMQNEGDRYQLAAEQSYNTGYEDANTDELRSDLNLAYTDARAKLVELIGEDAVNEIDNDPLAMQAQYDQDMTVDDNTKYAIAAYVSAKSAWDGVQQRISDDAADRADQRRAEGEKMAYKGKGDMQGAIRPLTINEESREEVVNPQTGEKERKKKVVYLVNGTIAIEPNGNGLSREGTDKTIYVYDPETGDTHELDPFAGAGVLEVGEPVSMEDYLANNEQQSQAEVQQEIDNATGKVNVQPNTPFVTPEGRQGIVKSVEGDNVIVQFADGEMEEASIPLADMQQYADALRRQEYEARHPQQTPAEQPQQPNTATEGQTPTAEQTAPQDGNNADTRTPAQRTYDDMTAKYGEKASHKVDVTLKDRKATLDTKKKALDKAQTDYDDAPIGKEDKAEAALAKAQEEYDTALADYNAWDEVRKLRDQALLAQSEAEDAARKAKLERKRAEETEAQRKQREAYEADQTRRKAEAEAAEKRRQEENERLRQQEAEAAANPQAAEEPAPIEGTKGQQSQLAIARQELADDPGALAMLEDMEPTSLEEVAALLLTSGKGQVKLLREDFMAQTGYSSEDVKRYPFIFAGKEKGGITLAQFGEKVIEEARDYNIPLDDNDAMVGVNAVLNMLSSVGRQSDINDYVAMNRIRMAYDYHNTALAEARARMLEAYGMTEGEYEAYMSWLEDAAEQRQNTLTDEQALELINQAIQQDNERQAETNAGNSEQQSTETTERTESAETDTGTNGERGNGETNAGTAEQPQQPAVSTAQAIAAAEAETYTNPTEGQKEAGNYKKGHVRIDGYDITIEQPKGSVRRGTDKNGRAWEQEMHNTYGYIRGTESVDGDHIDVFLSDDPTQGNVYVVDQVNEDGTFDEHKVMYGFPDMESARQAYLSNYEDGWRGLGTITPVSKEEFKKWIESSHRKTKPFSEYKGVKTEGDVMVGEGIKPAAVQTEGTAEVNNINPNYKPKSERELLEQEKRELEDNLVKYRKGLEDNDPMEVTNHKWYRNQIKITEDRLAEIDKRLTELNNKAGKQPKQEPRAEKEEANEQPRAAVGENEEQSGKGEKVKNEAAPKEKIDDVGEKIGGARKDLAQKMGAKINLDADTFPKMFPKFDLKKAVEQGLDPKLASAVYILRIEAQQSYKSRLKHYSKENALSAAKFWAAYAKQFLENGNTSTEFKDSRWTFTEYGKKHIEYNLALYEKVYEKFGNTLFDLDFSGYTIRPVEKNKWNHYYRRNEQGKEEEYQPAYEAVAGYSSKYYTDGELDKAIDELVNRMAESVSYKESHPYKLSHYYTPGVANSHYIGVKLGGKVVALTEKMGDKETSKYLKEHEAELQEKAKRLDEERKQGKQGGTNTKWKPELGLGGGRARVGNDYRNGKDVSAEEFRETFGFRGVEFGNYVTQAERQRFLNEAYDAMMDLAALLNVSPRALSLGGRLGFAIGARGGGNAVAHYEPDMNVINLTKSKGAGSLAHEWWHALDYYFNSMGDRRKTPATANKRAEDFNPGHRAEMANAFVSLMEKINGSDYRKRSVALDAALSKDYYTNPTELGARAFQDYVQRRLTDKGQVNDFLSSFTPEEQWNGKAETYPYPTGKDADAIDERFDNLFGTMLEREDEQGNVMLYERADGKAAKVSAKEQRLRDAVVGLLRNAGIEVVTDSEEGQRVLDMANGRERQHRVYHGSGADFEAFDHSHMGEGEGNQTFGWGTYVTEVEGIGRTYAERMSEKTIDPFFPEGTPYYKGEKIATSKPSPQLTAASLIRDYGRDGIQERAEAIFKYMKSVNSPYSSIYEEVNNILKHPEDIEIRKADRIIYTVEIPEDNGNNYLDWDKKASDEQTEAIKNALMQNEAFVTNLRNEYDSRNEWTDKPPFEEWLENVASVTSMYGKENGKRLYNELSNMMGSEQAASEFLHSAGFVGIKYPADYYNGGRADNAKNYVIFNEGDLQITDKVKFFRTENGEAYGFTMGGKIYLDPKIATAETPIHEYTHLWAEALRQANPKAWEQLKSELEKDKDLMAYVQRLYPELKGDELMDEVFAHFSGRRGAERLRAEQERMEGETRSIVGKAKVIAMFERLRDAMKRFWNMARDLFAGKSEGVERMNAEDFADMAMADLLNGVKPERGDRVDRNDRERDAEYMEAVRNGDMEKAQRMVNEAAKRAMPDTKVVDKNGNPLVVYHGTKAKFNIFRQNPDDLGFHFGNKSTARNRVGRGKETKLVPAFIKLNNPIVFDEDLGAWEADYMVPNLYKRGIITEEEARSVMYTPTMHYKRNSREANRLLKELLIGKGYDGIIYNNYHESNGSLSYAVFSPSQIKSADPVTYDDNGNVIPLSKRFNKRNADIRYEKVGGDEIAQRDKEYAEAVAAGDKEKIDAMLREEMRRKGYADNSDYQGSLAFNGAAPSSNAYFETREERKEAFDNGELEGDFSLGDFMEAGIDTHDLEWQLANPIAASARDKATLESINNLRSAVRGKKKTIKMYRAVPADLKEGSFRNGDWVTPSRKYAEQHIELQDWEGGRIIEQEVSVDDIWWNGDDINEWGFDDGKGYAYKNTENNRKLMEPTYDDNGNLIPLSERFTDTDSDVRFRGEEEPVFYSNAMRAVENIKQERATPEQWVKMIEKNGGLKAGEDKWLGLSEWLKGSDAKTLTKGEVLDYIRANEIQVEEVEYGDYADDADFELLKQEYDQWLHEDGYDPDYAQERLIERFGDDATIAFTDVGGELEIANSEAAAALLGKKMPINSTRLEYTTEGLDNKREIVLTVPTIEPWNEHDEVHFGEAGGGRAVAWVRFGETTDADGKRVLVIDEIQSKRHQEGREKGYKDAKAQQKAGARIWELMQKYNVSVPSKLESAITDEQDLQEYHELLQTNSSSVPDAPFDKNWHEVALKRMLRFAAENGYDKVAWTKGEQQAERYDIGDLFSKIESEKDDEGYHIVCYDKHGNPSGAVRPYYNSEEEVIETFGKDLGGRLIANSKKGEIITIQGDGLRIGAEGMKGFYDQMLPRFMDKYGKKWGVKTGEVELPNIGEGGLTMWGVDVTEDMRESVMRGQPLFRPKTQNREGGGEAEWGEWYDRNSVERIGEFAGYTPKQIAKMNERQEQSARKQFNDAAEKLHLSDTITFADSIDDVQGLTDEERKERRDKKGWYDIKTGKIVIILGNHKSMDDVMKSILHEGVAHHGLRQMFGRHFDMFLTNVYETASPEIRERIDEMAKRHGWDFRETTEEYLAMLAEDTDFEKPENQSWWKQVKEWFIDMLHKIGFKLHDAYDTITDNELRYVLWRSYENLVHPGRYNSVVEEAKDIAKQYDLKVGQWDETWTIAAEEEPNATIEYGGRRIPIWATNGRRRENRTNVANMTNGLSLTDFEKNMRAYQLGEHDTKAPNESIIHNNAYWRAVHYLEDEKVTLADAKAIAERVADEILTSTDSVRLEELQGMYDALMPWIEHREEEEREMASTTEQRPTKRNIADKKYAEFVAQIRKENPNIIILKHDGDYYSIEGEDAKRAAKILGSTLVNNNGTSLIGFPAYKIDEYLPKLVKAGVKVAIADNVAADGVAEDGVRFRDGEDDKYTPKAQAAGLYERAMNDGWNQFTEAMQDSMMSVKKLVMSVLEARGEKGKKMRIEDVAGYENPWLAENRLRGSIKNQVFAWQRDYMEPLRKAIYDITGGIKPAYDELMDYMMAKHGLERNEVLAKRDAKKAWEEQNKSEIGNPNYTAAKNAAFANIDAGVDDLYLEQRKKDYAGLTALTGKEDVEEAEKEAQRMVDEYEKRYDTTKLWEATNRATRSSLFTMLECGMMTPKRHAEIRDMFKYYIPLQGFDSDVAEDVYAYMGSDGTRLYGTAIRAAKGRKSKADDPIATIAMNGEAAIRRGNRNLMKQHFLRFVQAHPSDLVSVSDVWLRKNVNGEWEQYFDADLKETDTPEEVADKVRDFNERMEQEAASNPDLYKRSRDLPNVPFRVLNTRDMKQHQVMVQVDGKNYLLTVNGNPRAAQALNGLSNPDVFTESIFGKAMNIAQSVTRELSQFYTTRKPSFVLSNFSRDSIYTNLIVGVKEDKKYSRAFHKNWVNMNPATMGKLFSEWVNGELRDKILAGTATDTERMFNDFLMYGGETGWISMRDIERQKKDLQKALKQEGNTAAQKWKSFWATVDLANRAVENCARFAAFMTSQQMGRSIERSVWDAKEISVNFEKKGAGDKFLGSKNQTVGGWIGAVIGGWCRGNYAFWNAGVQGISNFYRAAKKKPGKFALRIFAMNFTLGMMAPLISALLGGDDDDENSYFNLPEYKRRNNLCFRFTKHMPWITIPLPIEFRAIYGLGELAMCHMLGKEHFYNGWDCAKAYMQQLSQVLPLDFLEGGGKWHVLIPTYAKPAVEAYANESWTGLPIYKENKYGQYDELPEWQRAYPNTNMLLVNGTRWINEATVSGDQYTGGNNEDVKGFINWNPARIEYMLRGYLGGYYSMYEHSAKTISTIAGKREFEWRNIPLAHVLITEGDERTAERSIKNEYYKIVDDYENTDHKLSQYDEKAHTEKENEERRQKLNTDKRYLRHEIVDIYKTLIDKLNDTKKNADEEEKKAIEEYQAGLRKEMVDMVHNLESKSKSELEKGDNLGQIDELAEQALGSRYESGDLSVRKAIGSMTAKRIGERYGSEARDGYGSGSALDTEYGKIYEKHRTYTDMAGDIMLNEEIKRATAEKDYVRLDALEGAKKDIADNRDDLNQYMTQEGIDNVMEVIRKIRRNALYPEQAANPTDNVEE